MKSILSYERTREIEKRENRKEKERNAFIYTREREREAVHRCQDD